METMKWSSKGPRLKFVHQKNIAVEGDGSRLRVSQLQSNIPLKDNAVQCLFGPLTRERRHYSIKVLEIDSIQYIMMGVAKKCWPLTPSWDLLRSLRYHSNDGGVFNGETNMRSHQTYTKGDSVTCQVLHLGRSRCLLEFQKNGKVVFQQWLHVPASQLYPTLGFSTTTTTVEVDWPLTPAPMLSPDRSDLSSWLGQSDVKRAEGTNEVRVAKLDSGTAVVNMVGPRPLDYDFCYFEMEIPELGTDHGALGIGVVPPVFSRENLPGWTDNSIGFHSDNGGLYQANKQVNPDTGSQWQQGDVVGCGVLFRHVTKEGVTGRVVVTVYFTRNGTLVHRHRCRLIPGGAYPCVAFMRNNKADHYVKINTKADPKVFQDELQGELTTLNAAEDLLFSDNVKVSLTEPWLSSVEVLTEAEGFVQMTAWPMQVETQTLAVQPLLDHSRLGSKDQIEIGVAMKMTSPQDKPTWLCRYKLTSGQISMNTEFKPKTASKYEMRQGKVTCTLDYTHEDHVIVVFRSSSRVVGRGMFTRPDAHTPVCATVGVTAAGGAKLNIHWEEVLFPPECQHVTEDNLGGLASVLENWLPGDETMVTSVNDKAGLQGSSTTIQAPSYFAVDLHYVEVTINKTAGQFPTLGVTSAWSDLQSLIGSRREELSLDPMTGEVLTNNEFVPGAPSLTLETAKTLGIGVLFTKASVRAPQDVVVYFTANSLPFHQMVFSSPVGGVYATITFPTHGCEVSVNRDVYPKLPVSTSTAWLQNILTNKEQQEKLQQNTGMFSALTSKAFTSQNRQGEGKESTQGNTPSASAPTTPSPATVIKTDPTIVRRGKISFTPEGEAVIHEVKKDGSHSTRIVGALEKPSVPENPQSSSASASEGPGTQSSGTPGSGDSPESSAGTTKEDESSGPEKETRAQSDHQDDAPSAQTAVLPGHPTVQTPQAVTSEKVPPKASKPLLGMNFRDEDMEGLIMHQSMHPGGNIDNVIKMVREKNKESTSSDSSVPGSQTEESESAQRSDSSSSHSTPQKERRPSTSQGQDVASTSDAHQVNPSESPSCEQATSGGNMDSQRGTEGGGGRHTDRLVQNNLERSLISNVLIADPGILQHDHRLRNAQLIQSLNEREAKAVLTAINQNMPPDEMTSYLSDVNPGTKDGTSGPAGNTMMTTVRESTSSPTSQPRMERKKQTSKACTLS